MARLEELLAAATEAETALDDERARAIKWFKELGPGRRLLSEEDRHKEAAQFVAFFGSVGMMSSAWWRAYEAYRKEVDAENERRATRINWLMLVVTLVLAAIGGWQGYEAHQQTLALRKPPQAPAPIVIPAPIVTVNVLPAPILVPSLASPKK
jgi:hypothetical protein